MAQSDGQNSGVIEATQKAAMSQEAIKASGAGKAYQSVAQSTAIAVQDAADYLRNVSTISTTAQGVAMAKFIATKDPIYLQVIQEAQKMTVKASAAFKQIGTDAGDVLKGFPSS